MHERLQKAPSPLTLCQKSPSRTPSYVVSPRLRGLGSLPQLKPAHRMERPGGDGATKAQRHRQAGCASSTRTRATLGPVHQETAPVFQNKLVEVLLSPHMPANLTNTIRNTNTEGPHHGKPQSESAPRLDRNSSPSSLPPRAGGRYSGHLSVTDSCLKHNPLKGSGSWEGQVSHTLHSSASCLPKRDPFALAAHLQDNCGKRETREEEKRTLVLPTLAFRRFCLAFRRVSSLTTSNELGPNGDRRVLGLARHEVWTLCPPD
ncbi:hypothetical protein CPAR01_15487 [Colletotrichum paranaense]|uniref:Uncharacterized protein n=1 Tax=Colletotrichum paranaense TaxID=1914294 RepID=A0ABQ9RZB7_9PEZI|nr:uncharacterized protein CPAR01_15487 [Colletotrichum paranaense]KAK1519994.1 hypothetical protein CPAR01_15487 [Colletotrichum paranaense]